MINNFTDGAPRTAKEWQDLGYEVIPCNSEGVPIIKGWDKDLYDSKKITVPADYMEKKNIPGVWGVRLEKLVDLDIDNPILQKFLGDIICGAKFGRKSNPFL